MFFFFFLSFFSLDEASWSRRVGIWFWTPELWVLPPSEKRLRPFCLESILETEFLLGLEDISPPHISLSKEPLLWSFKDSSDVLDGVR